MWQGTGAYEIDIESRGQGQRRLINLVDWADLPPPSLERLDQVTTHIGDIRLAGTRVLSLSQEEQ